MSAHFLMLLHAFEEQNFSCLFWIGDQIAFHGTRSFAHLRWSAIVPLNVAMRRCIGGKAMKGKLSILVACLVLSGCGEQEEEATANANFERPNSLGRWCAKPSTVKQTWQIIEIVDGADPIAHISAGDGSSFDRQLAKSADGEFSVEGDAYGARYRLSSADADVGLYDNQGLIYFAKRMAPSDPPTDCLGS